MTSPVFHVVYQSAATVPFEESELGALLTQARRWNADHALTGVLLYGDGRILQVLEGAEADVRHIFARIARDHRHTAVVKLAEGPIKQRQFAGWSMGFKPVDPAAFAQLRGFLDLHAGYPAEAVGSTESALHNLLADFVTDERIRL